MRRTGMVVNTSVGQRSASAGLFAARFVSFAVMLVVASLVVLSAPVLAWAAGPNAIMTPAGYNANTVARGDDTANMVVGLPFTMNWNGTDYTQVYINMNGNVTFNQGFTTYNPTTALSAVNQDIMAPFWADVDTRNTSMGAVTYSDITAAGTPLVDGHKAFFVNWIDVGRYNYTSAAANTTNSFQLVLIDRSDTGAGNFDFMYNYDAVTWDLATSSSSQRARVGWGRSDGTGFELAGSGTAQGSASALLDSSPAATSLIANLANDDGQLGRYVWQVRNGTVPNAPPVVTVVDRVLEGNATDSYLGYLGTGDATATDPDGTIARFSHDRPAVLTRGTTTVTWTAVDSTGATTQRTQSIVVADSTPPSVPTLSSGTHPVSVWRQASTVAAASTVTTDICSGVTGVSYSWSAAAPQDPDTVPDTSSTSSSPQTLPSAVEAESFASATWPSEWERVLITGAGAPATYVRSQNSRAVSGFAAEVYATNTTRRTFGFQQDFNLAGLDSATLSFSQYTAQLDNGGADYSRVEYSVNGGTSWTQLLNTTTNITWTARSYALPVGGVVRVRFSGSVNANNEFCAWDNLAVDGTKNVVVAARSVATTSTLSDGAWYFNLRSVDAAGNWSGSTSYGPVLVDVNPPVTASDAPSGWSNIAPVNVSLTATDAAGAAVATRYRVNGSALSTYTAAIPLSTQGTSTVDFWSIDAAGNKETTKTATVRIDTGVPTAPGAGGAAAVTTASVEVTWTPSTDVLSGVRFYSILRDGSEIATTTGSPYTDTDVISGDTYVYRVVAVDWAGNESAPSPAYTVLIPSAEISLTLSTVDVDLGSLDPATPATAPSALTATVGGVGAIGYDLSCSASNFASSVTSSTTPTMPVSALTYVTHGAVSLSSRAFTTAPTLIHSGLGTGAPWQRAYLFDYSLSVPWAYEPGTYTTVITYTVVMQ